MNMANEPLTAAASGAGRLAWRSARLLWRIVAYGLLVLVGFFTLVAASCRPGFDYIMTPAPDRLASLVLELEYDPFGGEPGRKVSLTGGKFDSRVLLGNIGDSGGLGWIDDTTVNVCPLRHDERLPMNLPLVGEDGVQRIYKIVALCTPEMVGEPALHPRVEGFDFSSPASEARQW
jgi:hypothetical protein